MDRRDVEAAGVGGDLDGWIRHGCGKRARAFAPAAPLARTKRFVSSREAW
jgi:hypothetical protein